MEIRGESAGEEALERRGGCADGRSAQYCKRAKPVDHVEFPHPECRAARMVGPTQSKCQADSNTYSRVKTRAQGKDKIAHGSLAVCAETVQHPRPKNQDGL